VGVLDRRLKEVKGMRLIPIKFKLPDPALLKDGAKFRGHFVIEVFNNKEEMKLISRSECHNILPDEALNRILNTMYHDAAHIATWYCAIFEDNQTPDSTWTYDNWCDTKCVEWQAYDESARPEYNNAASSAKSTTNSANKAVFTANATKTLYGGVLVSVSTKGDHTSGTDKVLGAAGKFAASQPVISANVVNLTYEVTSADDGV
jgi:hypothetical protein